MSQWIAARQAAHWLAVFFGGDAESDEQLRRLALGRVPVLLCHDPLELGQTHARGVVDLAGEELLLFSHRFPELCPPRHDRVDDALGVVDEVVLLDDAELELSGDADVAAVPVLLPREHADERRLADAVGAGDAVALSRVKLQADALEKDLRAETLGDSVENDHG
jgi:hypothetical protein